MVDAIYCVSLSRLPERRSAMVELLLPFVDTFDVYIFDAIDWKEFSPQKFNNEGFFVYDSWKLEDSSIGWYSRELKMGSLCNLVGHFSIWNHIYSNYDRALILEDDVRFNLGIAEFVEGMNRATRFMDKNDCDIFYLSCWPVEGTELGEQVDEHIEKCNLVYNSHSYIVNKDSAKELFSSGIRENLITTDEYLASTFCEHRREDIRNLYTNRKLKAYRLIDDVTDQNVTHKRGAEKSEVETSLDATASYKPRQAQPYYHISYDMDVIKFIIPVSLSRKNVSHLHLEVISNGEYLANAYYSDEDFGSEWFLNTLIPSDEVVSYNIKINNKIVETGIKEKDSLFFDVEYYFSNDMLKMEE